MKWKDFCYETITDYVNELYSKEEQDIQAIEFIKTLISDNDEFEKLINSKDFMPLCYLAEYFQGREYKDWLADTFLEGFIIIPKATICTDHGCLCRSLERNIMIFCEPNREDPRFREIAQAYEDEYSEINLIEMAAFINGAKWADKHPVGNNTYYDDITTSKIDWKE